MKTLHNLSYMGFLLSNARVNSMLFILIITFNLSIKLNDDSFGKKGLRDKLYSE